MADRITELRALPPNDEKANKEFGKVRDLEDKYGMDNLEERYRLSTMRHNYYKRVEKLSTDDDFMKLIEEIYEDNFPHLERPTIIHLKQKWRTLESAAHATIQML